MSTRSRTIFARSSGAGRCGVAVYRLSGPESGAALRALTGRPPPAPGRAVFRRLLDPADGAPIDDALVLRFPAPASYTGEDVAELQVHGSLAVERRLLATLCRLPGLRPAEPGEFTRRALDHGKLDLARVEGLADLIEAETESQRRLALRSLRGEGSERIAGWRDRLLRCLAPVEALVDFPEDLGADAPAADRIRPEQIWQPELAALQREIRRELAGSGSAERLRSGIDVAVIGPPNVGKSTLVNALVGREFALTTPEPGTTRDVLEARLDLAGLPVTLLDTAGLRPTADRVEALGVQRAEARARLAELRIHVSAPDVPTPASGPPPLWVAGDIRVRNKADLPAPGDADGLRISARTGAGLPELVDRIAARLASLPETASPTAATARRRQRLESCLGEVARAEAALAEPDMPELLAEHLRLAIRELDRFTGRLDAEEVLDRVFADFCLGK